MKAVHYLDKFYRKDDLHTTNYLFKFIVDNFWFFVSLKPHHVFRMKPPTVFFQGFRCQILSLRSFHIVENEEQRFCRQFLKKF